MKRLLADVHCQDQTVLQCVHVFDHSIEQDLAREVANYLVNSDNNPAGRVGSERLWFDVRVDHAPLASPVGADAVVPVDRAAFHAVRPHDVGSHGCECAVDIAGVKGGVCLLEQFDFRCGSRYNHAYASTKNLPSRMICSPSTQMLNLRPTTSMWVVESQSAPVCAP